MQEEKLTQILNWPPGLSKNEGAEDELYHKRDE